MPKFTAVPAVSLCDLPPQQWIVKGVLPMAGLAIIFGESGSGKSFFCLDLAAHIGSGAEWRGRRVKQGAVAYIAAEGALGFRKRVIAYRQERGELENLHVIEAAPDLRNAADVAELIAVLRTIPNLLIVFYDTLAQCSAGANENTSEDMGKIIGNIGLVHRATGALQAPIHHAGKDLTRGARGWSGLKAAADAEIEIATFDNGLRRALLSKSKDDADGIDFTFRLQRVVIGEDSDGDPITSCVIEEADPHARPTGGRPFEPDSRPAQALALLKSNFNGAPVSLEDVKRVLIAAEPFASMDGRHRSTRVMEALKALQERRFVRLGNSDVTILAG